MNDKIQSIQELAETAWYHFPKEHLPNAVFAGGGALLVGVVIAVWGAKLLRPIFALTFVASGAWYGGEVAKQFGISETVGIVIGAIVMGVLGYVLYRLWVAGMSAVLVGLIAISIYASYKVIPHWSAYYQPEEVTEFEVGSADNPQPVGWESLLVSLRDFWEYLKQEEADVSRNVTLVLGVAALVGFFLGLFAERAVTIVWTSALGVVVATAGIVTLCMHARPEWRSRLWEHPQWLLLGLACLWVLALGVQTQGTRRTVAAPAPKPAA
jgi:hypothetical protein